MIKDNFDTYGIRVYLDNSKESEFPEKRLRLDADVLFGFFALFSILVDVFNKNNLKYSRSLKGEEPPPIEDMDITDAIKIAKHPIFKFIRWIIIARYESEKEDNFSIADKIHREMDSCNFTFEQRKFIWQWIRQEIELINGSELPNPSV